MLAYLLSKVCNRTESYQRREHLWTATKAKKRRWKRKRTVQFLPLRESGNIGFGLTMCSSLGEEGVRRLDRIHIKRRASCCTGCTPCVPCDYCYTHLLRYFCFLSFAIGPVLMPSLTMQKKPSASFIPLTLNTGQSTANTTSSVLA